MKEDNILERKQQLQLIEHVTVAKVYNALGEIDDKKAQGCDGFNSLFFKRTWSILGQEITNAVTRFFATREMHLPINVTSVSLIPKVKYPSSVKEFRPISCCTVLYNIISKILTNRLHEVMDALADNSQSAFVPGRVITNNIILNHELVKGYGRKGVSPRCMIILDMHTAYDSVEWPFLEKIFTVLNFPTVFVNWIMKYVCTVSYSILINGSPT